METLSSMRITAGRATDAKERNWTKVSFRMLLEGGKMKKALLVVAALLLSVSLVACGGDDGGIFRPGTGGVHGIYVNEDDSSEYLELDQDGTFFLKEMGTGFSGEWEIKGNTITFHMGEMGLAARGTLEDGTIVDEEGKVWVKEEQGSEEQEQTAQQPTQTPSPTPTPLPPPRAEDVCPALRALAAYRYSVDLKIGSGEQVGSPTERRPAPTSTITREFTGPFLFEYEIEGSFVAPDRYEASVTVTGGSFAIIISIGDQRWYRSDGVWSSDPRADIPYKPPDICEAIVAGLDLSQVEPLIETANNVKAIYYALSEVPTEEGMAKIFGDESDMAVLVKNIDVDLWLAENGSWPVRMQISGTGAYADGRELQVYILVDIRDANSGDIQVEPPS